MEAENEYSSSKISSKFYAYDDPLLALSEFKPNFYDLLLVDVNMPKVNGFEFSEKILKLDFNVRVCYISAGEMNIEALREQYPTVSIGCFIKKPITRLYQETDVSNALVILDPEILPRLFSKFVTKSQKRSRNRSVYLKY